VRVFGPLIQDELTQSQVVFAKQSFCWMRFKPFTAKAAKGAKENQRQRLTAEAVGSAEIKTQRKLISKNQL
jgi:hypothetical protein